jgi:hypothetical protein
LCGTRLLLTQRISLNLLLPGFTRTSLSICTHGICGTLRIGQYIVTDIACSLLLRPERRIVAGGGTQYGHQAADVRSCLPPVLCGLLRAGLRLTLLFFPLNLRLTLLFF